MIKQYTTGMKSTGKFIALFNALIGFSNEEYKNLVQIDGFQQDDFEELKKSLRTQDSTKNQFMGACGTLLAMTTLIHFDDQCEKITINIRKFKESMVPFDTFENELYFLKRTNPIFEDYEDVRKKISWNLQQNFRHPKHIQ